MQKKILITNVWLNTLAGTELVVRDLARGFKAKGHIPMIYTPVLGDVAHGLIAEGITVVDDLTLIPAKPDIIHGHHHIQTLQALMHFPDVPAIYVCHDVNFPNDLPPKHDQILTYVAVSYAQLQRVVNEAKIPWRNTKILPNVVDIDLFKLRAAFRPSPEKALFFSNYTAAWSEMDPYKEACQQLGISFDAVGFKISKLCANPEAVLGDYDIVFGVGKCAIEALAVGCAVIPAFPATAIGQMINMQNVKGSMRRNFAQCMRYAAETPNIIAEINKYDSHETQKVTQFIRKNLNLEHGVAKYLKLYDKTIEKWKKKKTTYNSSHAYINYLDHQLNIINEQKKILSPYIPRTLDTGFWRPLDLSLNVDFRKTVMPRLMKKKIWLYKRFVQPASQKIALWLDRHIR